MPALGTCHVGGVLKERQNLKKIIMADEEQSSSEAAAVPSFHSSVNVPSDIEGDIHIAVNDDSEDEFTTLDEPVSYTLVSRTG